MHRKVDLESQLDNSGMQGGARPQYIFEYKIGNLTELAQDKLSFWELTDTLNKLKNDLCGRAD
jgi:hypothetical protein